jgi:hypothetical protein
VCVDFLCKQRRNGLDTIINVHTSLRSGTADCQFLTELEFSQQIFEKYSNIKFHENPSAGAELFYVTDTDRHDEANNLFSHFGNPPKKITQYWSRGRFTP